MSTHSIVGGFENFLFSTKSTKILSQKKFISHIYESHMSRGQRGSMVENSILSKTDRKCDFTIIKIVWVDSKSNKSTLLSISKSSECYEL